MADSKGPAWGYRKGEDGQVEARLFPDGLPAKGWHDTPEKVKTK